MPEPDPDVFHTVDDSAPGQRREYSSAEELARYTNTTLETFSLIARHAGLAPVEIEGKRLYRRIDVQRFLIVWEIYNKEWR